MLVALESNATHWPFSEIAPLRAKPLACVAAVPSMDVDAADRAGGDVAQEDVARAVRVAGDEQVGERVERRRGSGRRARVTDGGRVGDGRRVARAVQARASRETKYSVSVREVAHEDVARRVPLTSAVGLALAVVRFVALELKATSVPSLEIDVPAEVAVGGVRQPHPVPRLTSVVVGSGAQRSRT